MTIDKYERPIHPLVEAFVDSQLDEHPLEAAGEDSPPPPLLDLIRTMKEGWGDQTCIEPPPTPKRISTKERFSTFHIARNPLKLPELELANENYMSMISSPPEKGAVRIYMDPVSIDTSYGGITADTFQGVATLITPTGPFKMEGARWHLLSQVFSSSEGIKVEIQRERLIQGKMDKDPTCRSFSWKVLRQAKIAIKATTYVGDTALTAPPFFDNAVRGDETLWGTRTRGPRVINWTGLSHEDREAILPSLRLTNDWIIFASAGKTKPGTIPFLLEGSKKAMTMRGKAFRK